jgi:hypothetical protein
MKKTLITCLALGISVFGEISVLEGTAFIQRADAQQMGAEQMIPARIRGTIDTVNGQRLDITTRGGDKVTLMVDLKASYSEVSVISPDDIKPGSFIGTTAVPGKDGTLTAIEVHVFPESMRGTGEGHRPWDLAPQSTMTNGTVGEVTGSDARFITVKYKEGVQKIFIPAEIPVVTMQKADRSLLRPGAHVIIFAMKAPDGVLTAVRVVAGKNGLVPPM